MLKEENLRNDRLVISTSLLESILLNRPMLNFSITCQHNEETQTAVSNTEWGCPQDKGPPHDNAIKVMVARIVQMIIEMYVQHNYLEIKEQLLIK